MEPPPTASEATGERCLRHDLIRATVKVSPALRLQLPVSPKEERPRKPGDHQKSAALARICFYLPVDALAAFQGEPLSFYSGTIMNPQTSTYLMCVKPLPS